MARFVAARLKPTYEGWKLIGVGIAIKVIRSLKPTYEGWKLDEAGIFFNSRDCLKPTYEGWKLRETLQSVNVEGEFEAYL